MASAVQTKPEAEAAEVLYATADHIATITLNRPERMNTISGPMLRQLTERLLEAEADKDVRVIVLMFFSEPATEGPVIARPSVLTYGAIGIGTAVTLVLGVAPQPLLDLANHAAQLGFIR